MKFPKVDPNIGLFILRVVAGGLMLTHGYPKLVMLFSGGEIMFPDPIGLGAKFSLIMAVFSEFLCAILLILGVKTRFVAVPLAATMFVAAFVVHGSDPFAKKELALIYLGMYGILIACGGGKYSLADKS